MGSGLTAFAAVERNAVIAGGGAGEDEVLAVRAPPRAGVDVARIIGPRQWREPPIRGVVPGEEPTRRVEDLEETEVLEVGDVVGIDQVLGCAAALIICLFERGVVDARYDVAPVGGDLRREADPQRPPSLPRYSTRSHCLS